MVDLDVLDAQQGGRIDLFSLGEDGTLHSSLEIPRSSNRQVIKLPIRTQGVDFMRIDLKGSGAIDNIRISVPELVSLDVIGVPLTFGATFEPTLGNPASGVFSWTPRPGRGGFGNHAVNFRSMDDQGRSALPHTLFIEVVTRISPVIDFERRDLSHGSLVDSVIEGGAVQQGNAIVVEGAVLVKGSHPGLSGENAAAVFDATCPQGCTGEVEGFLAPDQGHVLIVAEDVKDIRPRDRLVDRPIPSPDGGTLEFDYSSWGPGVVTVKELVFLDPQGRGGLVELFFGGEEGKRRATFDLLREPGLGIQTVPLDISWVDLMRVTFNGRAAIDDIRLDVARGTADFERRGTAGGVVIDRVFPGPGINVGGFVSVLGVNPEIPNRNSAILFDATCQGGCSGGDDDLLFPEVKHVLIIAENLEDTQPADGVVDDPSDAETGGFFEFDFSSWGSGVVMVIDVDVLDTESGGRVELYSGGRDGALLKTIELPKTKDHELRTVPIHTIDVDFMRIRLDGSGAIDNVRVQI